MNSLDKAIIDFVNKASKRIKINFLLNLGIEGLKISLALSLFMLLISLLVTFPYVEEVSIIIVIVGLITTVIYGIIKAPNKKKSALIIDSKGLEERVTTSLELIGLEDNISIAQKEDTINSIKNYDLKKSLKIKLERKQILLVIALIAMCITTGFIDTTSKLNAKNIRQFDKYQKEMVKKIEEEKNEIEKIEELTEKEKEEVKKILEDAKKELKESEKKLELDKTLERLDKKLEAKKEELKNDEAKKVLDDMKKKLLEDFKKEKEESAKKDLNKIVNELMKKKESKPLGEAIMSKDNEAIKKELSDLKKSLGKMSSAELSKISESLSKAASEVSDEELAKALEQASNSVLDGNLDAEDLANALASANSNGSKGQQNGENKEKVPGQGSDNGEGEGSGQGQGAGQGQGGGPNAGQGWNTGSTTGNENDLENSKGEEIYIPGREQGNDANLSGNKNEAGESQNIETQSGLNLDGSKVNYDKVIGDYTNSALEGANNSNLPESLKDIIKDYFQGLN